jgi:acyl-CoA thioesterase FadM
MRTVEQPGTYSRLTAITLRPRYEHAGARLRLGVRGLTSLAEEALVNWFRVRGISPSVLSERYGREFAIVDWSGLLSGAVSLDDEVVASAVPVGVRYFNVQVAVPDGDAEGVALRARVTAVLVRRPGEFEEPVEEVHGMLVDSLEEVGMERLGVGLAGWRRPLRVPMDGCHHGGRMQHSAHVRALTELAEAFVEDRGLPAKRLLDEHGLVMIMPRVRVRLLADAYAGEVLHTGFEVHQAIGGNHFDCRFDAHVEREGRLVPVAVGILLLGFARVDDTGGRAAELSADMIERLTAERAATAGRRASA